MAAYDHPGLLSGKQHITDKGGVYKTNGYSDDRNLYSNRYFLHNNGVFDAYASE